MIKMDFLLCFIFLFSLFAGIKTQENAQGKLSNALLECYNNTDVLLKDYKLPQNIHSFIAIIRKIEDNSMLNMDLRQLSVALIHRFRQDGIVFQPLVDAQPGVTPYAPNGFQFYRHAEMLKLIPGNAQTFPNNSITKIERCSLHSMVSSTIDTFQRGDESSTCRVDNESTRILDKRSIDKNSQPPAINQDDVETLSPEQIEIIKNNKDESKQDNDDKFLPNNWYPALPPNHPENSHLEQTPTSQCPSESGVMKTDWGVVSGGPVLAGIAAALQPQNVKISDLMMRRDWSSRETLRDVTLDNKWIATLAGDLVEVALRQGPMKDTPFKVGTEGHFITSIIPKNYYLNEEQALELTAAEIRGDLDGLIIANEISYWYSKVSSIKLSQILDMYYSDRGVFNTTIRACNRKNLLKFIAQNDTITKQTFRAALVLGNSQLPLGTISDENIEKFSIQVVNKLFDHVSTSMSSDKNCQDVNDVNVIPYNRLAIDLKIFVDTTWPFNLIKPILHLIIEKSDVNKYASNFTLLNAKNGEIMINSSYSILDIYSFNETQYASFTRGFDLPKTLDVMKNIQTNKLNHERDLNIGGGKSDIYLIIPYSLTSLSDTDRDYSLEKIIKMREDAPDGKIIFLTGGTKDRWSSLVVNSNDDIFTVGSGTTREIRGPIDDLISRIKKIQRRLINSQCGANYESIGYTASFTDYIEPSGINFYRLHPNYFFKSSSDDNQATIKIQGQSTSGSLKICYSRETLDINSTRSTCTIIDSNTYSMTFGCSDANYIHECSPLFLSIFYNNTANTNYQCIDSKVCRYPDMIKYTISYENLNCKSTATLTKFSPIFIPIICLIFKIFNY